MLELESTDLKLSFGLVLESGSDPTSIVHYSHPAVPDSENNPNSRNGSGAEALEIELSPTHSANDKRNSIVAATSTMSGDVRFAICLHSFPDATTAAAINSAGRTISKKDLCYARGGRG
jgi:hypothetical protein